MTTEKTESPYMGVMRRIRAAWREGKSSGVANPVVGTLHVHSADSAGAARGVKRRFGVMVERTTWLEDTERVQRDAYGLDPAGVPYVKEQATAAIVELAEMLQSLPWKAGRDGLPGREPTETEMGKAREELVDVVIFAGNLAVALGYDDRSLWVAVNEKACRNVERRRSAR